MKAMYDDCSWGQLQDIFSARHLTSNYVPGDEAAYGRAISACGHRGQWEEALELLADLLMEKERPGSGVFEVVLEVMVQNNQVRFYCMYSTVLQYSVVRLHPL
jgi:pentatricopeptide repeat protein